MALMVGWLVGVLRFCFLCMLITWCRLLAGFRYLGVWFLPREETQHFTARTTLRITSHHIHGAGWAGICRGLAVGGWGRLGKA
ncbi:hypothetical protein B0T22DRAFT_470913 [Podospora appendiculata]|uniref:Uncharacterized protein n=1 Tax=Podospora appendiculata TaxID=314037 RepID=A0AAE0X0U6_9PEZI|nr:hypothetical protein B0T22DRAFT_470913 [Podospora appendiculata]